MGKEKPVVGKYIRIAEDDSANAAETVDANECFRHDDFQFVLIEE